jgi:hypothetical protein
VIKTAQNALGRNHRRDTERDRYAEKYAPGNGPWQTKALMTRNGTTTGYFVALTAPREKIPTV